MTSDLNIRDLEARQLDALREVANIGAGHAATALSQLTKGKILVDVPRLRVISLEEVPEILGEPDQVIAAVMVHMLGDLTGRSMLVFPRVAALRITEILLHRPPGSSQLFSEMEQSALKEAGNILSAAYMNALSDFMGLMLLPSVPGLVVDQAAAVLTTAYTDFGHERETVFCIDTHFGMDDEEAIQGHFLLLPDVESLQVILKAIRIG